MPHAKTQPVFPNVMSFCTSALIAQSRAFFAVLLVQVADVWVSAWLTVALQSFLTIDKNELIDNWLIAYKM